MREPPQLRMEYTTSGIRGKHSFSVKGEGPGGLFSDAFPRWVCIAAPPGRELSPCRRLCDRRQLCDSAGLCEFKRFQPPAHAWESRRWRVPPGGRLTHCPVVVVVSKNLRW